MNLDQQNERFDAGISPISSFSFQCVVLVAVVGEATATRRLVVRGSLFQRLSHMQIPGESAKEQMDADE